MPKTGHPSIEQVGDRFRAFVYVPRAVQRTATQKRATQQGTSASFLWLDNAIKWQAAAVQALKAGRAVPNPARFRTIDEPNPLKEDTNVQ